MRMETSKGHAALNFTTTRGAKRLFPHRRILSPAIGSQTHLPSCPIPDQNGILQPPNGASCARSAPGSSSPAAGVSLQPHPPRDPARKAVLLQASPGPPALGSSPRTDQTCCRTSCHPLGTSDPQRRIDPKESNASTSLRISLEICLRSWPTLAHRTAVYICFFGLFPFLHPLSHNIYCTCIYTYIPVLYIAVA